MGVIMQEDNEEIDIRYQRTSFSYPIEINQFDVVAQALDFNNTRLADFMLRNGEKLYIEPDQLPYYSFPYYSNDIKELIENPCPKEGKGTIIFHLHTAPISYNPYILNKELSAYPTFKNLVDNGNIMKFTDYFDPKAEEELYLNDPTFTWFYLTQLRISNKFQPLDYTQVVRNYVLGSHIPSHEALMLPNDNNINNYSKYNIHTYVGTLEAVRMLRDEHIPISFHPYALHYAIRGNHLDIVKFLVEEEHININLLPPLYKYDPPLIVAINSNNPIMVKYLLDHGAETNISNKNGKFILDVIADNLNIIYSLDLPANRMNKIDVSILYEHTGNHVSYKDLYDARIDYYKFLESEDRIGEIKLTNQPAIIEKYHKELEIFSIFKNLFQKYLMSASLEPITSILSNIKSVINNDINNCYVMKITEEATNDSFPRNCNSFDIERWEGKEVYKGFGEKYFILGENYIIEEIMTFL